MATLILVYLWASFLGVTSALGQVVATTFTLDVDDEVVIIIVNGRDGENVDSFRDSKPRDFGLEAGLFG
jgi:hypothetical protein